MQRVTLRSHDAGVKAQLVVRRRGHGGAVLAASRRGRAGRACRAIPQRPLSADMVLDWVATQAALQLGPRAELTAVAIEDGVINSVWRVQGPGGEVILKQALPHLRVDPSFPLTRVRPAPLSMLASGCWQAVRRIRASTLLPCRSGWQAHQGEQPAALQERMAVEARAMAAVQAASPSHVPALLSFDAGQSILVQSSVGQCPKLVQAVRDGLVSCGGSWLLHPPSILADQQNSGTGSAARAGGGGGAPTQPHARDLPCRYCRRWAAKQGGCWLPWCSTRAPQPWARKHTPKR